MARTLDLYVVLSEYAELTTIPPRLLLPDTLPSLWPTNNAPLNLGDLYHYFSGYTATIQRESYSEPLVIPRAARHAVNQAINEAVKAKHLWLINGSASILGQDIPADLFTDDATLRLPPSAISASELLPDNLPEAWNRSVETTALALADALSTKHGLPLPWLTVREAISNAINARFLELAPDSATLSVDYAYASAIKLRQRSVSKSTPPPQPSRRPEGDTQPNPPTSPQAGMLVAEATLNIGGIQELADRVSELQKRCTDYGLTPTFTVRIEVTGDATPEQVTKLNELLKEISAKLQLS